MYQCNLYVPNSTVPLSGQSFDFIPFGFGEFLLHQLRLQHLPFSVQRFPLTPGCLHLVTQSGRHNFVNFISKSPGKTFK